MHLGSGNVAVSKVGLATHSASDGPYMDTYLVRQTEGMSFPYAPCPVTTDTGSGTADASGSGPIEVIFFFSDRPYFFFSI